jgi:hypothetical protein
MPARGSRGHKDRLQALNVRSNFLPRETGALPAIDAAAYVTHNLADILAPGFARELVRISAADAGRRRITLALAASCRRKSARWSERAAAVPVPAVRASR